VSFDFNRVRASAIVKMFGATRALAGVDLTLEAGKVTVIEGPNGAGKSTLLDILSLLSRPTRGTLLFGERDAWKEREQLRASLGVLGHAAMLYPDLSGRANLEFFAELYRVGPRRVEELGERFEVGGYWERPARTYSRGQLQRVALARALLHQPRLILLDEPSAGLDARSLAQLVEAVKVERARGAIIALITHDSALSDQIADERLRLTRGRVSPAEEARA
jgi:heme exporter protein A